MKKISFFALALGVLLAFSVRVDASVNSDEILYSLVIKDAPAENGKRLNMSIKEIERHPSYSIVEVDFESGGSVSSSLFVLRGLCGLMRERSEKYFQSKKLSSRPRRYRIDFLNAAEDYEIMNVKNNISTYSDCVDFGF